MIGEGAALDRFGRLLEALAGPLEPVPFLQEVLAALIDAVGAERGFLVLLEPDGRFRRVLGLDREGARIHRPEERVVHYAIKYVMEHGRTLHAPDVRGDRRFRATGDPPGGRPRRSYLCMPVRVGERVEGAFCLDSRFRPLRFEGYRARRASLWTQLAAAALRMSALLQSGTRSTWPSVEDVRPLQQPLSFHGILSRSTRMRAIFRIVESVAPSKIPVLLAGESGTGKELLARAIHAASGRGPFLSINCGAVPEGLLEAELFGHVRGAFTGADADRPGLVEQADGGTLLLDEVGDMSPAMQGKLLRVLEEETVRRLGGGTTIRVDVRVVSSTNRDLRALVEARRFREDLFWRLRGMAIEIPPLRERPEDIPLLAEHFLATFSREAGREPPHLAPEALARLAAHAWPGNVRELENEMRRIAALAPSAVGVRELAPAIRGGRKQAQGPGALADLMARLEKEAVEEALERAGGNKTRAARLLGITRKSLYRRMEKHGLR